MRILIIIGSLGVGGTEMLTTHLLNNFSLNNDCAIIVFHKPEYAFDEKINERIRLFHTRFNFKNLFKSTRETIHFIRKFNPDIILCPSNSAYLAYKLLNVLTPANHFTTLLSIHYLRKITFREKLIESLVFNIFIRKNNDYIVNSFTRQKNIFSKKFNINYNRFITIHNGTAINEQSDKIRSDSKILHLLHIANFRKEKDQFTLLKALVELNKRIENWQLYFRGKIENEDLKSIKLFLQNNCILEKVIFLDFVNDNKYLYKEKDLFILTSRSEALPMTAIEAMSFGLPCILTDVGGCEDIVDHEVNGYLVPPGNHVLIAEMIYKYYFLTDEEKATMSENALKKANDSFNLEVCAKKYLDSFNLILNNK